MEKGLLLLPLLVKSFSALLLVLVKCTYAR